MRKHAFIFAILLITIFTGFGCCKKPATQPSSSCIEGVIVAQKSESAGGLPSCATVVQITNRDIGVSWYGYNNCVYIDNLPPTYDVRGTKIYFKTYTEATAPFWTTDCTPPPGFAISVGEISTRCQ